MRERVLTHPHSHKRCCCLRGVFAPLFGAVLMELPRGCKHNYTCTESDWGHNLDPGDKCTRCRSIYVIDAIEGLANASELLFSEPHNASSSFLLHVAACCCMLLHVAACCCVQMLANASWRRLSLTHTPRRCLNARLLLLRSPRPLFFTFRSPHHCHGDSHAHAVLKSKAKWLRWLCKATRSSPSPNKLQLLLCFSFSFLLL